MKKKDIYNIAFFFVGGLLLLLLFFSRTNAQKKHIILGAWTEGLFDPSSQTVHPEKLQEFEKLINKKVSLAHYYIGWEALSNPKLISQFSVLREFGWEPMLNVNPYYFSQCPATELPLYKAIALGKCDRFLRSAGKNLRQIQQPFYLLFAWEMNNKENAWSIPYTGSTAHDFIAAWRHIYTLFKQEKVTNVVWVFCPNIPDDASIPYSQIYPGNAYVDWVGLDGYNWGTTQTWSQWVSFAGVFTTSYKKLTRLAPKKPMMIAEVNTTDKGGNKGAWYTDMLTKQIPFHFSNVKAVVLFNEDRSKQENVNWKVSVTKGSLSAFRTAVHTRFY